jgi:hypothetical protein
VDGIVTEFADIGHLPDELFRGGPPMREFFEQRSTSALEIAEHLLAQAAAGERDLDRLKASALAKLNRN